jgi:murein DD-endopeptidase MepM/ murein hydrolase activator NlpD
VRWYRSLVLVSVSISFPAFATGAEEGGVRCNADLVCVSVMKGQDVRLVLESFTVKPLSFALFFSSNLAHRNPAPLTLSETERIELIAFPNPGEPWGFDYRIHYGHESREHDDEHVYRLPFAVGAAFEVTQSHTRLTTHRQGNRYAVDWKMPVGTAVHAARGGVVVSTFDGAELRSLTGSATANHIWIRHSDGTIGKYLHLAPDGVMVNEGQTVMAGDRIGSAGETGFASGPHLHFSVSTLGGPALYETFNVWFATPEGPRQLASGDRFTRPPDGDI